MKRYQIANLVVVMMMVASCNSESKENPPQTLVSIPADYFSAVDHYRREQNYLFKGPDSPLPDSAKGSFDAIHYYETDTTWRVIAAFEKINNGKQFKMQATGGIADNYQLMGKLKLTGQLNTMELEVYQRIDLREAGYDFYFIPFYDLTNGNETYGGGRYLDIPVFKGESTVVDFNYSYQPYCAYNHDYSCPIPPPANKLNAMVRAGERL